MLCSCNCNNCDSSKKHFCLLKVACLHGFKKYSYAMYQPKLFFTIFMLISWKFVEKPDNMQAPSL